MIEDIGGDKEHLHVVLTSPSLAGEIGTASISTQTRRSETLVCIKPGEHPFITRPSIVSYAHAEISTCSAIAAAVSRGVAREKEKVSPELLRRMQAGLRESDFTPPAVRAYYIGIAEV